MSRYIEDDWAWLAVDAAGHLALFTTAGSGPVPSVVLDQSDLVLTAETLIAKLPILGKSELHVQLPRPDDFVAFARRGFFAYDWSDVHRTIGKIGNYELMATPTTPRLASQLIDPLSSIAKLVVFDSLMFPDHPIIAVDRLISCESR